MRRQTIIAIAAVPVLGAAVALPSFLLRDEQHSASAAGGSAAVPPWVGAYPANPGPGRPDGSLDPQTLWDTANKELGGGRLTYRRCFDKGIPSVGREAWRRTDAPANFYSLKPPGGDVAGYIAGTYDTRLRAVIKALPARTVIAVYHEPEDDMPGQTFAKLTRKTMSVVEKTRPELQVWYVAMAFQWKSNSKGHTASNAGWIDAARQVDGVGIDVYTPTWDFRKMQDDKGFTRWWQQIKQPSGKPWGVIERGISGARGRQPRIDMLNADWAFAKANAAYFFLYWNDDVQGQWTLNGAEEKAAFRAIAAQGRSR